MPVKSLSPGEINHHCDPLSLGFETTDELQPLEKVIGQPRAFKALELGSEVSGQGFNIFIMGAPDSGRTTLSKTYLEQRAANDSVPDDWCYAADFKDPRKPIAIRLKPGTAQTFKNELGKLIKNCQEEIRRAFSSDPYQKEQEALTQDLQNEQEQAFHKLKEKVQKNNFRLSQTPVGFMLVPTDQDGKALDSQEINKLSADERKSLQETKAELENEVQKSLEQINQLALEMRDQVEELNQRTAGHIITPLIKKLRETYTNSEHVRHYLDDLQADILEHLEHFLNEEEKSRERGEEWFKRYEINVMIDNSGRTGAPVVLESHPSYHNLIGRIEHRIVMGSSQTDFTLIRPGAFHKANGGYLLIPVRDMLLNPYAWEGIKRTLRDQQIRILELGSQAGMISTVSLEPEPIPLDIKIVLLGTPLLYYLLQEDDEDFEKLFKIRAEFGTTMDRTPQNEQDYGLFVKSVVDKNHLQPFDRGAVACLIDYSSRMAGDQEKLTTRLGKLTNLIQEAAYWARKDNLPIVSEQSVKRAIQENKYRNNLDEELLQELIARGTILITLSGKEIGQLNGLSVLSTGDYWFGKPSRITAVSRAGDSGVVDIERQADLSGPIHIKGVLILSGFLGKRYAQSFPLNLSASITFEQSYSDIDGDSASAAELYALLSSIAGVPLRQDIAVTGSINQHGEIQAVGGINEKIEGFFAVCQQAGLTGSQGAIIPAANVRHLMLNDDVIQAVKDGTFNIWPIEHFDQGIPLLSGLEAGEADPEGQYPADTFNEKVQARLEEYANIGKKDEDEEH